MESEAAHSPGERHKLHPSSLLFHIGTHARRLLVPGLVVECALAAGARMAEPGEFTRRAFLAGKIDLTEAEGLIDLIDAETEAQG